MAKTKVKSNSPSVDRQRLSAVAEAEGLKGVSKLIDRLRYKSDEEVNRAIKQMESGFTPQMLNEVWSKSWATKHGGEQGKFKNASERRSFENRYKKEMLKDYVEKKPFVHLIQEEKKDFMNKSFKEAKTLVERDRVVNPKTKSKVFGQMTSNLKAFDKGEITSLSKSEERMIRKVRELNAEMGAVDKNGDPNLDSNLGFAVYSYMLATGSSKIEAMKKVVYSRIDELSSIYDQPTEIPSGLLKGSSAMSSIQRNRVLTHINEVRDLHGIDLL
jgi:hypothetical protein